MVTSSSWSRDVQPGKEDARRLPSRSWRASLVLGVLLGAAGALVFQAALGEPAEGRDGRAVPPEAFFSVLRQARADLDDGDYQFLPNRRSVWVVNRTNGRMATYLFHDDEVGSVDRSRVSRIDLQAFPTKDTVLLLSDRNLNNILWVCNVRTGDVQMWHLGRDGNLKSEPPVATSGDLRDRVP